MGVTFLISLLANLAMALSGATIAAVLYYQNCNAGFCSTSSELNAVELSAIETFGFQ